MKQKILYLCVKGICSFVIEFFIYNIYTKSILYNSNIKKKKTCSVLCDHLEKKNSYQNRREWFEIIVLKKK